MQASAVDREKTMKPDQDWESVWPAARTFHPASVPLPVRQGAKLSGGNHLQPGKAANAELMKIPNFLHLTPPVVSRHCKVLRENLCTQFPAGDVESGQIINIRIWHTLYSYVTRYSSEPPDQSL